MRVPRRAALLLPLALAASPAIAQQAAPPAYPSQRTGTWTATGFRFHTGQTMDVRQGYITLGDPANPAVLILHGTADKVTKPGGSQLFFDTAGSKDKTLKLYEDHAHDLLNDYGREQVMADIRQWIAARMP